MNRFFAGVVCTIVLLTSSTALARRGEIDISKVEAWQQKYTVVLTQAGDSEFCSGGIVGNVIYTAAHCCADMIMLGSVEGYSYSLDGINQRPIASVEMDSAGNDVCRVYPVDRISSPIRPGIIPHVDEVRDIHDRVLWLINKISYIYDDPELRKLEVQKVYRLAYSDEEPQYTYVQGDGMPGMSGSLILNRYGQYVGNLVIGLGSFDAKRTIPHVFGISL